MEVDDPSICSGILISKLSDKKPKVPPTCLELLKEGIVSFGARCFPIKDILGSMGPVLNGSNGAAREAAMSLMVELQRWIGKAPFNSLLESLRPAQKTDFERLCGEADAASGGSTPVPSLYLRKNRPAPGSVATEVVTSVKAGKVSASAAGGIDAREFVEEVDLNKKLKSTDYSSLITEEKWSEQLRALQLVIDAIGPTPKLKAGTDVGDIIGECKGFLRQGHIQLQVSSLKIIALLADGLRAEFGNIVRPLTQSIIQKAKEKRLVPEVNVALLNILKYCLPMEPLIEDLGEQIKSKKVPPHARECLLQFISTAVAECPEKISTDGLKPLVEMNIACCEDSDPKVRDACSVTLAALAPLVRSRGRNAVESHRLLMGLEQTAPR
jgi:cytoskeleton-associated protein 5